MSGIQGKGVAIMGASSGIGAATAIELAARGAAVVVCAARRVNRLDVVVSNAGLARRLRSGELDVDDWDTMIDINVRGVSYGIAAAPPVSAAKGTAIGDHGVDLGLEDRPDAGGRRGHQESRPGDHVGAVAFAIGQPDDVEIGDMTIRRTVQD